MPTVAELDAAFFSFRTPSWKSRHRDDITWALERAALAAWRRYGLFGAPLLDLDFTRDGGFNDGLQVTASDLLTTTRASDAYAPNAAGVYSLFSSNVPRITDLGLLVEEARTNSVRNNSMQGAVAGTPGTRPTNWASWAVAGLTQTIVGTGTENGVEYIDVRFNGTASSAAISVYLDSNSTIAATNGQTWAISGFLSRVGGSASNVVAIALAMDARDSGGGFLAQYTSGGLSVGTTQSRFSAALTTANASTAYVLPYVNIVVTNGAAVDITLRIGWPQLELGAFATSPIRTTSAAATRAADAITVTSPPTFGSELTLFVRARSSTATNAQVAIQADNGTTTNRVALYRNGTTGRMFGSNGGTFVDAGPSGWADNSVVNLAARFRTNDMAVVLNGGTPTTDAVGTIPGSLTTLRIGGTTLSTDYFNSYIERAAAFAAAGLTNAQLQALTA